METGGERETRGEREETESLRPYLPYLSLPASHQHLIAMTVCVCVCGGKYL